MSATRYVLIGTLLSLPPCVYSSAIAREKDEAYTTSIDALWSLNIRTGAQQFLGHTSTERHLSGLSFDPLTGDLYAVSDEYLLIMNTTNATLTWIGKHGLYPMYDPSGLAFDPAGNLFLINGGTTYTVSKSTGAATVLGPNSMTNSNALAFSSNGRMFAIGEPPGMSYSLVELNPATGGLLQVIGELHEPNGTAFFNGGMGLDFDSRGTLYVIASGNDDAIYEVSTVDASARHVADIVMTFGSLAIFPDCNENGQHDGFEIFTGTVTDTDGNGIPDGCPICGDGTCDGPEWSCNCPADCGAPPSAEVPGSTCTDAIDNDCDVKLDCADPNCATDEACLPPPTKGGPGDLLAVTSAGLQRIDGVTGQLLHAFPLGGSGLQSPIGLALGPDGLVYVSGSSSRNVVRYDLRTGVFIDEFVPFEGGGMNSPQELAFGPDGHLYVLDFNKRVLRFDGQTGAYLGDFVDGVAAGLNQPRHLTFGPDGNLYVSNYEGRNVIRFDGTTGAFIDEFVPAGSGGLAPPRGLVFGPDNNLYVASEEFQGAVFRYAGGTGAFIDTFVQHDSGGLQLPTTLAFGPDGHLYVSSDTVNTILRYVGTTGAFIDGFRYGASDTSKFNFEFVPAECIASTECDDSDPSTTDICFCFQCRHQVHPTLYVDANATGANDGTSWADAFLDLQDALDAAQISGPPVDILIAEGTYRPDRGTGNRFASFQLLDGVNLYGGYAGDGAEDPNRRDIATQLAVLSGDLAQDDGPDFANYGENSYHVILAGQSGIDSPTLVDGVVISGGNANAPSYENPHDRGGGVLMLGGAPVIRNSTIMANGASIGAGAHLFNQARGRFINCRFLANEQTGLQCRSSDLVMVNCQFSGNSAVLGGAINNNQCHPTIVNCTFTSNIASQFGGGIYNSEGVVSLANSILLENQDMTGGGETAQLYFLQADWALTDCIVQGWSGTYWHLGTGNSGGLPQFVDGDGADNQPGTPDDDLRLMTGSTGIDDGDSNVDTDLIVGGMQPLPEKDLNGGVRILDAAVDVGATEFGGVVRPSMPVTYPHAAPKNRYISFAPDAVAAGTPHAYQVTHLGTGSSWYISTPRIVPAPITGKGLCFLVSDTTPQLYDFSTLPMIHVGGCAIVPGESYDVRATVDGVTFFPGIRLATVSLPTNGRWWADVVGVFSAGGDGTTIPPTPTGAWTPANGSVSGFDITAVLQGAGGKSTAPNLTWSDINAESPDRVANGPDVLRVVNAFSVGSGREFYPFRVPMGPGPQGQETCPTPPLASELIP